MITCVPEIKVERLTNNNDFMIIACDGIWDCLTSQECISMCRDYLDNTKGKGNLSVCIE
jgi:serine/threonine protein phosphatase PrpC